MLAESATWVAASVSQLRRVVAMGKKLKKVCHLHMQRVALSGAVLTLPDRGAGKVGKCGPIPYEDADCKEVAAATF